LNAVLGDLDRAIELAPDDYWYYYSRAMALAVMARYREAAQDLLVCVQSKDRVLNAKAHRRLAQIYDQKFEDMQGPALRHYELYLQMGGDDRESVHRCSELKKLELERPDETSKEEAQLRDLEHARDLTDKGEYAHAVELLTKIISAPALADEKLKAARELYVRARVALEGEQKANALYETASSMVREGKIGPARAILEEIMNKHPTSEAARTKAPTLLLKLEKR
jgi:tetratricopeptide (TPR) repeat protein